MQSGLPPCCAWGRCRQRRRRGWPHAMKSPPRTFELARKLRHSMTEPERHLWEMLRKKQHALRFRKQHPLGPYVLDFYCPAAKLCVEVDGPVHQEPEQIKRDAARDAWLSAHGIRVMRFSAADVTDRPAAVIAAIVQPAAPSVARWRHLPHGVAAGEGLTATYLTGGPTSLCDRTSARARRRGGGSWAEAASLASFAAIAKERLTSAGGPGSGPCGQWTGTKLDGEFDNDI